MEPLSTPPGEFALRDVAVRPTYGAQEHRRWDRLVAACHYLSFRGLFGHGLRPVATLGSAWIAPPGWQSAALRVSTRDRWIGWSEAQKLRRLHWVDQNSRFLILPGWRRANLASRVLGLSLRRLAGDRRAAHGFPVLRAQTFVDPARFGGTCCRAANWRWPGRTGGYARQPNAQPDLLRHGEPKEVFVYQLQPAAGAALRRPAEDPDWQGPEREGPPPAPRLRSLFDCLGEVQDYRRARGQRYSLRTVLAMAARCAGCRGVTACAQFARRLD